MILSGLIPHAAFASGQSISITGPSGFTDLMDVANLVGGYAFRIAMPIAVIIIIYAGLKFLLARGNTTETQAAKNMLWWAIVGIAIIVIGAGFITLIKDILGIT